jgi:hypothetical protein
MIRTPLDLASAHVVKSSVVFYVVYERHKAEPW